MSRSWRSVFGLIIFVAVVGGALVVVAIVQWGDEGRGPELPATPTTVRPPMTSISGPNLTNYPTTTEETTTTPPVYTVDADKDGRIDFAQNSEGVLTPVPRTTDSNGPMYVAAITGVFLLLSALVTGFFTHRTAVNRHDAETRRTDARRSPRLH